MTDRAIYPAKEKGRNTDRLYWVEAVILFYLLYVATSVPETVSG
jgi:hypothetical protein